MFHEEEVENRGGESAASSSLICLNFNSAVDGENCVSGTP
jgi:hypothetical protein